MKETGPGRFVIVGAGAIGAYVGAALARGGADVTLIARGAHLEAMRRNGVQVNSPRGDFHVEVDASDNLDAIQGGGVVFLGLKSYSLPEMAPAIGERLDPGAAVIAAQNGVPWWYVHALTGSLSGLHTESVDPGGVVNEAIPLFLLGLEFEPVSADEARWGTHAGDWETSLMLALAPDLVEMDRTPGEPAYPSYDPGREPQHLSPFGPVPFAWTTEELSATGAIGDPRAADAERGRDTAERTSARLAEVLAEIARFDMPRPAGQP